MIFEGKMKETDITFYVRNQSSVLNENLKPSFDFFSMEVLNKNATEIGKLMYERDALLFSNNRLNK